MIPGREQLYVLVLEGRPEAVKVKGEPPFDLGDGEVWTPVKDVLPAAQFYDHLRDKMEVVGVRYYLVPDERPAEVLRELLVDGRCFAAADMLDVLFGQQYVAAYQRGELSIDCVQAFNDDMVVSDGKRFGIAYPVETKYS